MNFVLVFLGGGLGSVCRYLIAKTMSNHQMDFPLATFVANILSCIILGYLIGLGMRNGISDNAKLLLMTGFCGGFSTFSTFSGEIVLLMQDGQLSTAMLYIAVSLAVCLVCIWAGIKLA